MEQITRKDNIIYYGERQCHDVDEAYRRFRDDYNSLAGRAVFLRLDHIGQRKEKVHGFGVIRRDRTVGANCFGLAKTDCRLLGLCHLSYWWTIDVSQIPEDMFDEWIEYALTKGSKALRFVGRNERKYRKNRKRH